MRLLVITQALDTEDTALGFFAGWIKALAFRLEKVVVLCLRVGKYETRENVEVYGMRMPGYGRGRTALRFMTFIGQKRDEYDAVFVHMNQEYVLLGALAWKLLGKKVFLWRNHRYGNLGTRLSVLLSDAVFYTSSDSFTARFGNAVCMPAGIDTEHFHLRELASSPRRLLMLGRIAPVKRLEIGMEVLALLPADVTLTVQGDALPWYAGYQAVLTDRAAVLGVTERTFFLPGVSFAETAAIYEAHDIFLNFTPSGSFDKTVIEALASGLYVLTSNTSMKDILPEGSYTTGAPEDAARKIRAFQSSSSEERMCYRLRAQEVVRTHSLSALMDALCDSMARFMERRVEKSLLP